MRGERKARTARRPGPDDIVVGARLKMVHGLHPGMVIEVVHVNALAIKYRYARPHGSTGRGGQQYRAALDWVISHTEVVE